MEIKIRRALKKIAPRLLELIHELAEYEKAPHEVTVTLEHFTESGFGKNPVWWAFVRSKPPLEVERGRDCRICFILYPLFNLERTSHVS